MGFCWTVKYMMENRCKVATDFSLPFLSLIKNNLLYCDFVIKCGKYLHKIAFSRSVKVPLAKLLWCFIINVNQWMLNVCVFVYLYCYPISQTLMQKYRYILIKNELSRFVVDDGFVWMSQKCQVRHLRIYEKQYSQLWVRFEQATKIN